MCGCWRLPVDRHGYCAACAVVGGRQLTDMGIFLHAHDGVGTSTGSAVERNLHLPPSGHPPHGSPVAKPRMRGGAARSGGGVCGLTTMSMDTGGLAPIVGGRWHLPPPNPGSFHGSTPPLSDHPSAASKVRAHMRPHTGAPSQECSNAHTHACVMWRRSISFSEGLVLFSATSSTHACRCRMHTRPIPAEENGAQCYKSVTD